MNAELLKSLQLLFVQGHQHTYEEITKALENGDIKSAHRAVHTLKSNAGLLEKTKLQEISEEIELQLKDGGNPVSEEQINVLKKELALVLEEYAPLLEEEPSKPADDPFDS